MIVPNPLYAGLTLDKATILLVPPDVSQAELPFALISDPERMESFMLGREPFRPEELEDYRALMQRVIDHPMRWAWWIHVDEQFVGLIATMPAEADTNAGNRLSAKIYYVVAKGWEGLGIATHAVERAVRYLFCSSELGAVEVQILTHNTASLRVAKKVGFEHHRTIESEYEAPDGRRFDVWHGYRFRTP
jgi:RimJ/RimL family protein N-acetyltransferase